LTSFALLVGCGGESEGRETVVAAFYPLAFAAERVAGDIADVRNLTPPGVEPHDAELSGRDIQAVSEAALVLYLGRGFQPALEDAVQSTGATAVDLLEGLDLLSAAVAAHESEDGNGVDESTIDPHLWLDPSRYAALVERIGSELGRETRAQELIAELEALDEEFLAGLTDCDRREIVTSHAAFAYLADRYDLEQVAITGLSPEAEPTPRELERVVSEVRESGATTVFFETLVSPRLARTVAREVGAETAVLNPLEGLSQEELDEGADYFSVMRDNLAALRDALGCR
jgi:zinc transport system substrate-binding protein